MNRALVSQAKLKKATALVVILLGCAAVFGSRYPKVRGAIQADSASTKNSSGSTRLFGADDVVSLRKLQSVQISPDGTQVAFVVEEPNSELQSQQPTNADIWIVHTDGSQLRRLTEQPGKELSPQWAADGKSVVFLGSGRKELGTQLFLVSVEGGSAHLLTEHPNSVSTFSCSPDGRRISFFAPAPESEHTGRQRQKGYDELQIRPSGPDLPVRPQELWTLEVETLKTTHISTGDSQLLGMQWSHDSKRLLLTAAQKPEADPEQLHQRLATLEATSGSIQNYCDVGAKIQGASWAPDGKSVVFQSSSPGAADPFPGALYVCQEGMPPKVLLQNMPYTVESFRWKPDGQSLFLVLTQGAHRAFGEFSLKDKKLSGRTSPPWEVAFRSSYSISRDGSRVAGILARDREPPDVWLLDADGSQKQLTHLNPQLSSCRFGESSEVKWQSRDGLGISGVLLKPVGYEPGKRVPMVVQVHGSQVADVNEFQGTWMNWGQLLAARGYAVLLPNYRGSLTDGASFARANQGDLGGKDFEDIMDGVDAMVQQGIADPERLGIGGVSYGGFLAAWAVTQTSRFRAAVMGLGISNWISMAGQTPGPEGMVRFSWLSSPYERSDLFWRRSPLAQVSKVKTPVLIYAGERDPLVPVSQSREFFRGLQHFAVPSQFILYPREGHSIQEPNHLRDNLNRLLDWYDRYLKSSS